MKFGVLSSQTAFTFVFPCEENSFINAKLKAQEERIAHQKEEVEVIQKRFKEQFEVLANNILEEKTKKFIWKFML